MPPTTEIPSPFKGISSPQRLLVITHQAFASEARRLAAHKRKTGMPTVVVTREQCVRYYQGPDDAASLKLAIYDGYTQLQVAYVFLFGDSRHIPVRHRIIRQVAGGWVTHNFHATDHYYSNLVKRGPDGSLVFNDWDANKDGFHNEDTWSVDVSPEMTNVDHVDGYPDVAVGRLPAETLDHASTYVDKIIDYEGGTWSPSSCCFYADSRYSTSQKLCDQIITNSGLGSSAVAPRTVLRWCNASLSPYPEWTTLTSLQEFRKDVKSSRWLLYVGHGDSDGWALNVTKNTAVDSSVIKALQGKPRTSNAPYTAQMPIVVVGACETGMLAPHAPLENLDYRDVDDLRCAYSYDTVAKKAARILPLPLTPLSLPVIPRTPSVYDLDDAETRSFATSWLCGGELGGAIAVIAESVTKGDSWSAAFATYLIEGYAGSRTVLGDIWIYAQRKYWYLYQNPLFVTHHHGSPRIYLCIINLFGDPSLRVPSFAPPPAPPPGR